MWTFLKILMFGGGVALTTHSVDIGREWATLSASKPLNVVTEGAALYISVSDLDPSASDVIARMASANTRYPIGCVQARLVGVDGRILEISNRGTGASNDETFLILSPADGIPTDRRFAKVALSATCELKAKKIMWQNYSE
jgi:hypothetical protein